jgi:hypothetical protein
MFGKKVKSEPLVFGYVSQDVGDIFKDKTIRGTLRRLSEHPQIDKSMKVIIVLHDLKTNGVHYSAWGFDESVEQVYLLEGAVQQVRFIDVDGQGNA